MNILLICNKKNLLGNAVVIYSALLVNEEVSFFIHCTEDIGEENREYLKKIGLYLDQTANIIFKQINPEESLEKQFEYVTDLWYISSDCVCLHTIIDPLDTGEAGGKAVLANQELENDHKYSVVLFNFHYTRANQLESYIDFDNMYLTDIKGEVAALDLKFGYAGQFSLNFNVPYIFCFSGTNDKIYETNIKDWEHRYMDLIDITSHLELLKTIKF